ncbi:MAG: hypothetical protein KF897_10820 [Opitutaceae bacterium]|nr:hypothetical protein [Opitutaceae bacterium]
MNFHHLLHQRTALLRQARLANLAFAWQRLNDWAQRIARARLRGEVTLQLADPAGDRAWPLLLARSGSQAVIEEHFTDEDIVELADILSFLAEDPRATEFSFQIEEMGARFLPAIHHELAQAGVLVHQSAPSPEDSNRGRD